MIVRGIEVLITLGSKCDGNYVEKSHDASYYASAAVTRTVSIVILYYIYIAL